MAVAIGLKRKAIQNAAPVSATAVTTPNGILGRNTAMLTLANGQKVLLDSASTGGLTMQGNARLVKPDGSGLSYSATGGAKEEPVVSSQMAVTNG